MRYFIGILAGIVLFASLSACAKASEPCYEDQPCFVWSKIGNHKRGITVDGKFRVVGPCEYAKLARTHRLDASNPKLRGDVWARMTCKGH